MKFFAFLVCAALTAFGAVDINSASKEELMGVKTIGPKKAELIIQYRTKKCFDNVEELKNVNGFGTKTIDSLKGTLEAKPCKEKPKK